MLCQYGCGNEANFKLGNGKLCCSKSPNSCPFIRKKNGQSVRKALTGKPLDKDDIRLTYISCKFCQREVNYCTIKLHERKCKKNPDNIKILPKDIQCETCNILHDGTYGSGRFCSIKCSKSRIHSDETKTLISDSLKSSLNLFHNSCDIYFLVCKNELCKKQFAVGKKYKNQQYCCISCSYKTVGVINFAKAHVANRERIKNGTFKGWQSRNNISYPEKFWIEVLKNNNLFEKCKVNHPVKKLSLGINCHTNYFLDFYFPDKKLDLEIDGKQHEYEDRKLSDKIRDQALINNGINVYRIKWKSINTDIGKAYMKNEIEKFLEYFLNMHS